jgi:hypothetical protein
MEALILARANTHAPVAFLSISLRYFRIDAQSETSAGNAGKAA